jgi:hypothetical protein
MSLTGIIAMRRPLACLLFFILLFSAFTASAQQHDQLIAGALTVSHGEFAKSSIQTAKTRRL